MTRVSDIYDLTDLLKHYQHFAYLVFHLLVKKEALVHSIDGAGILFHGVQGNFPAHHVLHSTCQITQGVGNTMNLVSSNVSTVK